MPQYEGNDYAVHTNDSPWLVNENNPITLASPFYGQQNAPRQHRNRTGFALINSATGGDNVFNFDELKALQFNNKSNLVDLVKDDLAAHCLVEPTFELDGETVDLAEGCTLLANWDGTYSADSIGAPIFREFISYYTEQELSSGAGFFAVPFDPLLPLTTPNTLLIPDVPRAEDPLLMNLAKAIKTLAAVDIPMGAPFSEWQFTNRSGENVFIPGASGSPEGAWHVVGYDNGALNSSLIHRPQADDFIKPNTALTADGYVVNLGPSYIMAVSFEGDAPKAEAVLVYGQSRDRTSVHHDDQMSLLSDGQLRPAYFTQSQVDANASSSIQIEYFE
jgi:acyl-homoserine-lactone acylase